MVVVVVVVVVFVMMIAVSVDVLLLVRILVLVLVFRHLSHLLDDLTIMVSLVAVYQFERVHLSDQNIRYFGQTGSHFFTPSCRKCWIGRYNLFCTRTRMHISQTQGRIVGLPTIPTNCSHNYSNLI